MDMQDKLLMAVLDIQETVHGLDERVKKLEVGQERVYDRIDGFLFLINRHEAEISAVRSKLERLEDRILKLETTQT